MAIEDAQRIVAERVAPGPVESVRLAQAPGRVSAAPVVCDMDYPPFAKAMMDGYAVKSGDVTAGTGPWRLRVVGQIAAGQPTDGSVADGEAMRINTGAPMPAGADAVVRVEDTQSAADDRQVVIHVGVKAGKNVDARAKYVSAGTRVIEAGVRLEPSHIAVAAAAGGGTVSVYAQPPVAVLVTGDELVDVADRPTGAQIRNSNGPMLSAMVRGCGAVDHDLGMVGDDRSALEHRIREGLKNNAPFLCISGGVSMGTHDFVPDALDACGVRVLIRRIAIRPGKPTVVGVGASGTLVFALPGNPLSGFVAFALLVQPALAAWEGLGWHSPASVSARLTGSCAATSDRTAYVPGRLTVNGDGTLGVESLSWRGSSDLFGFSGANGLIVRRPHGRAAESGERVSVIPLDRLVNVAAHA